MALGIGLLWQTMKFLLQVAFAYLGHWWSMKAIESPSCPLILSYGFKHTLSSEPLGPNTLVRALLHLVGIRVRFYSKLKIRYLRSSW